MTPIPVVLVEDEDLFRDLLRQTLRQSSTIRVVGAFASGEDFLMNEADLEYSVAVMDIELGTGPHGIQTALLLRRRRPKVGIVTLSQHDPADWVPLIPPADRIHWTYLQKTQVKDLHAITTAISSVAEGRERLDGSWEPPSLSGPVAELTPRQREILQLIAGGLSNAEIAQQLRLAPKSVEHAINRIYRVLHVATDAPWLHPRVAAARIYWQAQDHPNDQDSHDPG